MPAAIATAGLERKIDADSTDWKARVAVARSYAEAGRYDEAIPQLGAAARLQPTESRVPFFWGLVLLQHGRKDAALAKLKRARDLDPDNWRIRKQIWAIENPDKFYTDASPDYGWQSEQLKKEKK